MNTKWTNQELSPQRGATERNTAVAHRTLGKDIMKLVDKADRRMDSFWEKHLSQSEIAKRNRKYVGRAAVAVALAVPAALGFNEVAESLSDEPTFSTETTTFVAENGDGVWDAAEKVEGHDAVGIDMTDVVDYIESLPENQDALSDGLQAYEGIDIPVSVKS